MTEPEKVSDLATTEPDTVRLPGAMVSVVLSSGEEITVRVSNRELIAWDITRAKHKWPMFGDAMFLALTFCSWKAAQREKKTELTWEAWQAAVEDLTELTQDADADPTQPARALN